MIWQPGSRGIPPWPTAGATVCRIASRGNHRVGVPDFFPPATSSRPAP
jgi:hypothetical protein